MSESMDHVTLERVEKYLDITTRARDRQPHSLNQLQQKVNN